MTASERIRNAREGGAVISLDIALSYGEGQDEDGWKHYAYSVTLKNERTGATMETDEPTVSDVLYSLLSDASSAANGETFEEWAGNYVNLDELSYRDAEKMRGTYEAVVAQTAALRTLLGDDFDSAVFPPDDHEAAADRLAVA